jgi:16S rRNA G966 N2-methylase RsmD
MNTQRSGPAGAENTPGPWPSLVGADGKTIEPNGQVHEVAALFPLMEDSAFEWLVESIRDDGQQEPIWLDSNGVLLDGRNRLRACQVLGIEPRYAAYRGDDPVGFIIRANVHRRHLTQGQRAMLAMELLPHYEAEAARRKAQAPGQPRGAKESDRAGLHTEMGRAVEQVAKAIGSSGRAVAQAKRVSAQSPDLAQKVMSGELALNRAERIVRDREAERRRVQQGQREAELSGFKGDVDVRLGDFRKVLADRRGVDAIITDPPYAKDFLPVLPDLAAWADKVLTPDGVLVVLSGETYLDQVYELLGGHRPYRWTGCLLGGGPGYNSFARNVQSKWKPILVYGGGPRLTDDVFRCEGSDLAAKENHKWGQDLGVFCKIVERLALPGQTVCDPFAGSGTTLVAARMNGCNAVGCDIDAKAVETMRKRLGLPVASPSGVDGPSRLLR